MFKYFLDFLPQYELLMRKLVLNSQSLAIKIKNFANFKIVREIICKCL